MPDLPILAVAGPTGAGKSALALALAARFHGEIINFDSVQVYAGFDIGSAKLPVAEQQGISHHLLDLCSPSDLFTAGDFASEVRAVLPGIHARSRLPILCGGTGFYLRALLRGLSPSPHRDDALRTSLHNRESRRPGAIRRLLSRLDPAAAERIHPNDGNKSIRALELRLLARRPAHDLFQSAGLEPLSGHRPLLLALDPPREQLYSRLDLRCEQMWRGGLLQEVRSLLASGVSPLAKPFESLGYKQALRFLKDPSYSEAEALEEMKLRTRQYAKRQWTWFRSEQGVLWLSGFGSQPDVQHAAFSLVADHLKKTF
ncbi:MAG TPA: tRNA (adenosine(37)-N6)-dimethylallyltransferase MiaA [Bryobacteraceae bacterium]|nr:tRNA (adenosine(37)-N6)-dimethylallyltransferase MiaA [Bryobacteraceae bacterium]